jgi:hypothetical protein
MREIVLEFLRTTESGEVSLEDRLRKMAMTHEQFRERVSDSGQVLEVRSNAIPDGGVVITFNDATERCVLPRPCRNQTRSLNAGLTGARWNSPG